MVTQSSLTTTLLYVTQRSEIEDFVVANGTCRSFICVEVVLFIFFLFWYKVGDKTNPFVIAWSSKEYKTVFASSNGSIFPRAI